MLVAASAWLLAIGGRHAFAGDDAGGLGGLDEINPANVGDLIPAFTFQAGVAGSYANPPIVAGARLIVLTPFPHIVFALDSPVRTRR
jgi:hypothetical protein